MNVATDSELRYPIGSFQRVETPLAPQRRLELINDVEAVAAKYRAAVEGLSPAQLGTPYRPGGWTVAQTVHHVADSHMNSYVRYKLALTEEEPVIKPYDEAAWANLADSSMPVEVSLTLLEMLHQRWVALLRALTPEQWNRSYKHPERGLMNLDQTLALYSWHGNHHLAHITELSRRMGWHV